MFEQVGPLNYGRYVGKIRRLLVTGGFVLNHGITHNQSSGRALGSGIGEFVEEYVFPGGELAHVSRVMEGLAAQGLEVVDGEALREHYAKTLWQWVDRLEARADAAIAEVGEERYRVWRIYMAGSAHAFDRGWLSLWQLLAGKPLADGRLPHPLTREYFSSHWESLYSPRFSSALLPFFISCGLISPTRCDRTPAPSPGILSASVNLPWARRLPSAFCCSVVRACSFVR